MHTRKSFVPKYQFPERSGVADGKVIKYSAQDIELLMSKNILGASANLSPQTIIPGKKSELSGHLVDFSHPWEADILSPQDVEQFSAILSPGLGGGSTNKSLYESCFPISQLIDLKVAVYSPLTDAERREERFRKGLPYYYNETYINEEESENFFNKVLKKRFFNEGGQLKDPNKVNNLVLFGFSIGHRENVSHVNYLRKKIVEALAQEKKPPELLQEFFYKIALVNIGSPINWEGKKLPHEMLVDLESGKKSIQEAEAHYSKNGLLEPDEEELPELRVINYRSVVDMGTAKPRSDFNVFHGNPKLYSAKTYRIERPNRALEDMYVFGQGLVKESFVSSNVGEFLKSNILGHDLCAHAQTINDNEEALMPIMVLKSSTKFNIAPVQRGVVEMLYNPNKKPSTSDMDFVKLEWFRECARREAMKLYAKQHENSRG